LAPALRLAVTVVEVQVSQLPVFGNVWAEATMVPLTLMSIAIGCSSCWRTGCGRRLAKVSPGSRSTGNRLTVAVAAPVTILVAPGPTDTQLDVVVLHVFGLWLVAKLAWGHDSNVAFQAVQPVVSVTEWVRQLAGVQMWDHAYLDGASWVGPTWSLSCDQVGFMDLENVSQLTPDRLVLVGSGSCQKGLTDDVNVMLVDGAAGRILWSHKTKGQWFSEPGGYWARVAARDLVRLGSG